MIDWITPGDEVYYTDRYGQYQRSTIVGPMTSYGHAYLATIETHDGKILRDISIYSLTKIGSEFTLDGAL